MARKILKWTGLALIAALLAGGAYLAFQPDPGPYLVALRSDTPEQVSKALDALLVSDTGVYEGSAYPPATTEQLQTLHMRYFKKASGDAGEPLKGDTSTWVSFVNRISSAIVAHSLKR